MPEGWDRGFIKVRTIAQGGDTAGEAAGERSPLLWLHVDHAAAETARWFESESGMDQVLIEAMLAEAPRPRSLRSGDALLVILRAVNMNEGAQREDMVSVRVWLEPERIITVCGPKVMAIADIEMSLDQGAGPDDAGDFLVQLIAHILSRIGAVVADLDDRVDDLDAQMLEDGGRELRTQLSSIRREAIALRRYIAPQREVVSHLQDERVTWLDELHRGKLRETSDRLLRCIEDLDAARERAVVTQEELASLLAEQMNRNTYLLSIVAAVFLPLGLITGLLGINVAGMWGATQPWAFDVVIIGLVALGCVLLAGMKWLDWI